VFGEGGGIIMEEKEELIEVIQSVEPLLDSKSAV
jgi:hypothetical protein